MLVFSYTYVYVSLRTSAPCTSVNQHLQTYRHQLHYHMIMISGSVLMWMQLQLLLYARRA